MSRIPSILRSAHTYSSPVVPEGLQCTQSTPPAKYSRHILRHMLRAASYLPEPYLRSSTKNGILESYRRCRTKIQKAQNPNVHVNYDDRLKKYCTRARLELNHLRRAALGERGPLEKVIKDAYGRTGKRRRSLIADLLREDESSIPQSNTTLEAYIESIAKKPHSFEPSKKLRAFIESQQRNHPLSSERRKIRSTQPSLPETNLWGRPLPHKLADSKRAKFWSNILDQLLPPIPSHEWSRLSAICDALPDVPPRRATPRHILKTNSKASNIAKAGDAKETQAKEIQVGKSLEYDPKKFTLEKRGWNRLWASIFAQCPKMELEEGTKKWIVTWPPAVANAHAGNVTQPAARDRELFYGLSSVGRKTPKRASKMKQQQVQQVSTSCSSMHEPPKLVAKSI